VASALGELDTDREQRRKMLEVVDLFKVESVAGRAMLAAVRSANSSARPPQSSPNALSSISVASYVILELSDVSRC
jgi:hypothetical protein